MSAILSTKKKNIKAYEHDVVKAKKTGEAALRRSNRRNPMHGCLSWLAGTRSRSRHVKMAVDEKREAPAAASTARASCRDINTALFGVRRKENEDPSTRLSRMADTVRNSAEAQESSAERHRKMAIAAHKSGNKQKALRELKQSKRFQAKASSMAIAAEALETQVSLLEQTELQRSVADAIKTSGISSLACKSTLSTIETAADEIAEVTDSVDEVHAAMDEMASSARPDHLDDDALLEELEQMGLASTPESANESDVELGATISHSSFPSALKGKLNFPNRRTEGLALTGLLESSSLAG